MELVEKIREHDDVMPGRGGWHFNLSSDEAASLLQAEFDRRAKEIVEKLKPWLRHDERCNKNIMDTEANCSCGLNSILAEIGKK